jgi:16S rRNA (cytosine1402-N4)-methyltransferase
MKINNIEHYPVLYREVLQMIPDSMKRVLDCTFGHGGHASLILEKFPDLESYIGLDQDPEVEKNARIHFTQNNFRFVRMNFSDAELLPEELNDFDYILMDLGVSQYQLRDAERGFSFLLDGPLDMRMDPERGISAKQWLEEASESELARVLFEYGEERYSRKIARAICKHRGTLETTAQLADVIRGSVPPAYRIGKIHPATRSFQAIRIALNDELGSLERSLEELFSRLSSKGRLAVISFHSLEDRIVKKVFKQWEEELWSKELYGPGELIKESLGIRVNRKVITPGDTELEENPPSRSAKLRVFEKK